MKSTLHAAVGIIVLSTVLVFWTATVVAELVLDVSAVQAVKQGIVYGLFLLIPALAATGVSGFALARGRHGGLVDAKRKRMIAIGTKGLLVMVPAALYLNAKARVGDLDAWFYGVQALELVVGAVQIVLIGLNLRDGLRLTGRLRPHRV